jgi:hypothetical protein
MNREQLEHAIRASASISGEDLIVIVGSQSILGSFPEAPASLLVSMAVDAFPEAAPEKSDVIDGCIGELSPFHETHGYYVHGVSPETAVLPSGWRSRLVEVRTPATYGSVGLCLSPSDLAVSKLLAGRDKTCSFVRTMLKQGMVSTSAILDLGEELDPDSHALLLRSTEVLGASPR